MRRRNVLRRQKDFDLVYRKGKSVGDRFVVIFYKKNSLGYNRISYLASKKVGNSVVRSRACRLMKEAVRTGNFPIAEGYDIIFIARNTIVDAKCQQVQRSIGFALKRTQLVENE